MSIISIISKLLKKPRIFLLILLNIKIFNSFFVNASFLRYKKINILINETLCSSSSSLSVFKSDFLGNKLNIILLFFFSNSFIAFKVKYKFSSKDSLKVFISKKSFNTISFSFSTNLMIYSFLSFSEYMKSVNLFEHFKIILISSNEFAISIKKV